MFEGVMIFVFIFLTKYKVMDFNFKNIVDIFQHI